MRRAFRILAALAILIGLWSHSHAQVPMTGAGLAKPATGGGGAATTWNPADKNAGITLTGSNLVATNTGGAGAGVRTIASVSGTQKVYWELVATLDSNNMQPGVANSTWDLTTSLRGTANGIGARDDGSMLLNFANVGCFPNPAYTTGDNVGFALDFANHKVWVRVNGGAWCDSGNPTTNTGGADISAITGAVFPAFWASDTADAVTAKFSSASWAFTPPSGFNNQVQ